MSDNRNYCTIVINIAGRIPPYGGWLEMCKKNSDHCIIVKEEDTLQSEIPCNEQAYVYGGIFSIFSSCSFFYGFGDIVFLLQFS